MFLFGVWNPDDELEQCYKLGSYLWLLMMAAAVVIILVRLCAWSSRAGWKLIVRLHEGEEVSVIARDAIEWTRSKLRKNRK
jgi:hypothetical protein